MLVKIIKDLQINRATWFKKGEIYKVRVFNTSPIQFQAPYQVIEGKMSGHIISREYCIEVEEQQSEATFTTKEVKAIEEVHISRLNKANEEKERAQELVKELTKKMNLKNDQITYLEFLLEGSRFALALLVKRVKESEKV